MINRNYAILVVIGTLFLTIILILATQSQTLDIQYGEIHTRFSAERQSLSLTSCAVFRWQVTGGEGQFLGIEQPIGEKTICKRGDMLGTLIVYNQAGLWAEYTIRVGGFGLAPITGIMLILLLLAAPIIGTLAAKRRNGLFPQPKAVFNRVTANLQSLQRFYVGLTVRQPKLRLLFAGLLLTAAMALLQLVYPIVLKDSITSWLLYFLYLFFGVILPGSLVVLNTVSWRTDVVTWIGMGWVVGHGLELVFFLLAKTFHIPILSLSWVVIIYLITFLRKSNWATKIEPLQRNWWAAIALLTLFIVGGFLYIALNIPELSARPPYISDPWFHINNAHEFRDFLPTQDPRLAGELFNYHMFSYAPAAVASLVTNIPIANLVSRYAGLSAVWLLTLLLFNTARSLWRGNVAAAFITAILIVAPIDFIGLLSPKLAFGTLVMFYGVDVSTSTLGGYIFLVGILLPLLWLLKNGKLVDGWVIALLAFGGAGSKSMFGPLLVAGVAGVAGWQLVFQRRFSLRSWAALFMIAIPVIFVSIPLIFGPSSYSESIKWDFATFTPSTPFFSTFITRSIPDGVLRAVWLPGFAFLFLLGAVVTTWLHRKSDFQYLLFVWMLFFASIIPALFIALLGASQLFFLYYGLAVLSTLSGYGLVRILLWLVASIRQQRPRLVIFWAAFVIINMIQIGFPTTAENWRSLVYSMNGGVFIRTVNWLDIYSRESVALSRAKPITDYGNGEVFSRRYTLTDEIKNGLLWARLNLPKSTVFAANVPEASVLSGLSEHRAFFETMLFSLYRHRTSMAGALQYYHERFQILEDWKVGTPDLIARMKAAGISHLFVDKVNGYSVAELPGLSDPVYVSEDFVIYALP